MGEKDTICVSAKYLLILKNNIFYKIWLRRLPDLSKMKAILLQFLGIAQIVGSMHLCLQRQHEKQHRKEIWKKKYVLKLEKKNTKKQTSTLNNYSTIIKLLLESCLCTNKWPGKVWKQKLIFSHVAFNMKNTPVLPLKTMLKSTKWLKKKILSRSHNAFLMRFWGFLLGPRKIYHMYL